LKGGSEWSLSNSVRLLLPLGGDAQPNPNELISATDYTALPPPPPPPLPYDEASDRTLRCVTFAKRVVDPLLSALGLALTALGMHALDKTALLPVGVKLFAVPQLASGIILFGSPGSPPPPQGFLFCTIGAWAIGVLAPHLEYLTPLDKDEVDILAAALLLCYFKVARQTFVPTYGLAAALVAASQIPPVPLSHGWYPALHFLLCPWLSGHVLLYIAALVVAYVRRHVRAHVMRHELRLVTRASGDLRSANLQAVFERYDTDRSGFLCAGELKYAMQVRLRAT
jgi:hypothetical protein